MDTANLGGELAACRHCGCTIARIEAGWVDARGFCACVKAPPESLGHGRPAGFVLHEPMPGGLRGAPEPALCHRCEEPITGTPVTDDDDPLHRVWCSEECRDAAAEASHEQRCQPGVAT